MIFRGLVKAILGLTREVREFREELQQLRARGVLSEEELEKQKYALVGAAGEVVERKFTEMSLEERLEWIEQRLPRRIDRMPEVGEANSPRLVFGEVLDAVPPAGKVVYASDLEKEKSGYQAEIEEYWRTRGWNPEDSARER